MGKPLFYVLTYDFLSQCLLSLSCPLVTTSLCLPLYPPAISDDGVSTIDRMEQPSPNRRRGKRNPWHCHLISFPLSLSFYTSDVCINYIIMGWMSKECLFLFPLVIGLMTQPVNIKGRHCTDDIVQMTHVATYSFM